MSLLSLALLLLLFLNVFTRDLKSSLLHPIVPGRPFTPFSTLHWRAVRRVDRGNDGRVSGVKLELLIRAPPLAGILCRASPCNSKCFFTPNN